MSQACRLLLPGLAIALTGASLHGQPASFESLGFNSAVALSADGSIVVGVSTSVVYRWTAGMGSYVLGVPLGSPMWVPAALSADGEMIAASTVFPPRQAARWTQVGGIELQGFPTGGYVERSSCSGVSADGEIAVGEATGYVGGPCPFGGFTPLTTAFRQTHPGGPLHKLNPLPGLDSSRARGISSDGSTTVGESFASTCAWGEMARQACLWTGNGQATTLGALAGYPETVAVAASSDGAVVAGYGWNAAASDYTAFRWSAATGMESLGSIPGCTDPQAVAISGDGAVIVGECWLQPAGPGRAIVWDSVHGLRDLRSVLTGLGLNITGWSLTKAVGVTADGRTIAGNGINPAGQQEAWIAFLGDALCYPDCNGDGALTVADFGCFQTEFVASDPYADCNADGSLTVADFGCFQTAFVVGCP